MNHKGFILPLTLLIIGVMSLLSLTAMQHILLYYKAINKQRQVQQNFYDLEKVVLQLNHQQLANQDCILHEDSANQVISNLLQQKGCTLVNGLANYRYYIEDLGDFPCMVVRHKEQRFAAHHQRISVMIKDEELDSFLLQIRFISVGGASNCSQKEREVPLGLSSWRYLPLI